jgi:sulfonate transport system ATP-binding protein
MTNATQVHIRQLEKHFGIKQVLEGVNLDIQPGEFVAIVGKSGCGKSTLLRLIAGLDVPTRGEVWVNGMALQKRDPASRIMFQDARLVPWKRVIDNVAIGLDTSWQGQAHSILEHVGLSDRAAEWPSVLSGGERQRVALARALISKPALLLLDEPLGALDALTRIEMQELVERFWQEQRFTALLITHDVAEAVMLADRVVLIEHGRIGLDVRIDLPRPRSRGDAAFAALTGMILQRVLGR